MRRAPTDGAPSDASEAARDDARAVVRLLLQLRDHGCTGCVEDIDAMIERLAPRAFDVAGLQASVKALIAAKGVTRALLDQEITI